MKKFVLMFAVIFTVATAFVLTACGDDDEPAAVACEYEAGFSSIESSNYNEVALISSIYYKALGVTSANFTLNGSEQECNDKVIKACENAQKEVEYGDWESTFTFQVNYLNKDRVIYKYSYKAK